MAVREFHYRLNDRASGHRPGSHRGIAIGAGLDYAGHARLLDNPDPRRLDLRASIRDPRGEWLVRTYRQRAASTLFACVDVSASMWFGAGQAQIEVAADLVESMGQSAFSVGDSVGMIGFGASDTSAIASPARHGRGTGLHLANRLRAAIDSHHPGRIRATRVDYGQTLQRALDMLPASKTMLFLISDFHWPLAQLEPVMDRLALHTVVPVVLWDPAESSPPARDGLLTIRDAESGQYRPVWVNQRLRNQWLERVAQRQRLIEDQFSARSIRAFFVNGGFDPEKMSRYFLESVQ